MRRLSSALSIYQRHQDRQNTLDDLSRLDMHFRLKTGADMVIEETGIHIKNPFKYKLEDLVKWSKEQDENLGVIINNYKEYYDFLKTRLDNESTSTYKPYFNYDGYEDKKFGSLDEMITFLQNRIKYLRINDDSLEAYTEIQHRKKNLFELYYLLNGKNLENPIIKTYLDDLTFTNQVTVLQSVYEEEPKPDLKPGERYTPYSHKQRVYSLGEIIEMTTDPQIGLREKTSRPLILPHTLGRRLSGNEIYENWSGVQIFDIDLKFSETYSKNPEMDASKHRDIIFDKLKHYPWFVGVTLSASKRALHIYTKVSRMHNLFDDEEMNGKIQKYWYRMSYIQKYAAISYILYHFCDIKDVYTGAVEYDKNNRRRFKKIIDDAMAQPGQGIAINYDPEGKWSSGFIDLYPCLLYHTPPVSGLKDEDWLIIPEVKEKFNSWFYEFKVNDEEDDTIVIRDKDLNVIVDQNIDIDGIKQIDIESMPKGDKHSIRWRICNTIMYSFGDNEKARDLCHHILQSAKTGTVGQINSFIRTAIIHKKQADLGTIKTLKSLGVKIGLDEETQELISDEILDKVEFDLANNDYNFYTNNPDINIELGDTEYLGMKMDKILSSFKDFKINVIESAPNTGKTEFFKALAKREPVCLVIPFTSTIVAKIVNDDSINALFDVFYGDRSISELKKGRSAVMTFDKFASMPKSRYSMFKYIAMDESHLFFTSSYRLPVVSQTIENIRTYLMEDSIHKQKSLSNVMSFQNVFNLFNPIEESFTSTDMTKFILMSGTLTGELDYFNFYGLLNYIKVHKKHPYNKMLTLHLAKSKDTIDILLIQKVVEKLKLGYKIIHPTNRGDSYAKQMMLCVETLMNRKVKYEYYKRANSDEQFMEDINSDTTVDDIEILFCSDYLSVGIDIKDKGNFSLVFGSDFTAESIEQFNNRLRSTDIDCHVFYDVVDDMGMLRPNIINTNHIRYEHNEELQNMVIDEMNIANLQKTINTKQQYHAILGELFSKYFIEDYSGKIKYIKSAFEIEQFELQYIQIAKSLLYIKTALMNKYQYQCMILKHDELDESTIDQFDDMRREAKLEHDIAKSESFIKIVDFLSDYETFKILRSKEVVFVKENTPIEENGIDLHLGYDSNYLGGSHIITWNKKHKYSLEEAKSFVKKIRKLYSRETVNKIVLENTKENGVIEKIELKRYIDLMNLLFVDKQNSLSSSTKEVLEISYNYVNPDEDRTKIERIEYDMMRLEIQNSIMENYKNITNADIKSERRLDNITNFVNKFIDTIFKKRIGKENVSLNFRKIYSFDSENIKTKIEQDKIYRRILLNEHKDVDIMETEHMNEHHIIDIPNLMST